MRHLSSFLPGSTIYKPLFFLLGLSLLLVGCGPGTPAPVVNAWLEPQSQNSVYIVGRDDTLYSIAWQFGLDYLTLAKINHLSPPYSVHPGQRLKMTNIAKGQTPQTPRGQTPTLLPSQPEPLPPSPPQKSHWAWPAQGKIIQPYSVGLTGNAGVDITGRAGSMIRAAQAGEVVYCGNGIRGYGNLIIIKHNRHYLSAYANNQQLFVHLGQKVQAGETIAAMGKNESGQTMLHFEIRYDGRPVDPLRFLS